MKARDRVFARYRIERPAPPLFIGRGPRPHKRPELSPVAVMVAGLLLGVVVVAGLRWAGLL